MNSQRLQQD